MNPAWLFAVGEAGTGLSVLGEIKQERQRQVREEGYPPDHDDYHAAGELAAAAACYALSASGPGCDGDDPPPMWPWEPEAWNPKDARRDLIRAAALIVAEIERLDRAAMPHDATESTMTTKGRSESAATKRL